MNANIVKFRSERTRRINQGDVTEVTIPELDNVGAVYYQYVSKTNTPVAIGFTGTAKKPKFAYAFKSGAQLEDFIDKWVGDLLKKEQTKTKRREARNQGADEIAIGDMFYSSWGYDCTIVDAYQVVGKKGKTTLLLQQLTKEQVAEDRVRFIPNKFASNKIYEKRFNAKYQSIKFSSFQNAYLEKNPGRDYYETPFYAR